MYGFWVNQYVNTCRAQVLDLRLQMNKRWAFNTLLADVILTWEKLGDDLVLHNNVRDLRLDLDRFPGQLGKDLLTEQNVLSGLQLHVPCLCAYQWREQVEAGPTAGIRRVEWNQINNLCPVQDWLEDLHYELLTTLPPLFLAGLLNKLKVPRSPMSWACFWIETWKVNLEKFYIFYFLCFAK